MIVPGRVGPVSCRSCVVSVLGRFGLFFFRPWVVSTKFGGSFRPDFFEVPLGYNVGMID